MVIPNRSKSQFSRNFGAATRRMGVPEVCTRLILIRETSTVLGVRISLGLTKAAAIVADLSQFFG